MMKKVSKIGMVSYAVLAFVSGPALAQTSGGNAPAGGVAPVAGSTSDDAQAPASEDIIVTAQKRSERLSTVPISITAATGDSLIERGITSPDQLDKIAPGFSSQKATYGNPVFTIRGVGFFDTAIGGAPAVSVYLDQVPLPYTIETRGVSLDLERVEVLKGPQGTLFGQSSTAGAINYIAAKPTDTLHAGFTLDYGRFNAISPEAYISGPITDTLSVRVAGRYEYSDGWQKPDLANNARFGTNPSDRNGARRFATGRVLVDWKPTDRLSFELAANAWTDRSQNQQSTFIKFVPKQPRGPFTEPTYAGLATLTPTPKDPRLAGWDNNRDLSVRDDFHQFSLRGDLDLGGGTTLTSITAYSRFRDHNTIDADGTAYKDLLLLRDAGIKSFSQELRLAGEAGPVNWMVGGNYASDHSFENQISVLGSTNAHLGPFLFDSLGVRNDQRVKTYAGFGSVDYHITPALTVQASARYTKQNRDFAGCLADPGNGQLTAALQAVFHIPTPTTVCLTQGARGTLLPIVTSSLNEDNVSFRGSVNWQPNSNTLLYASISKGYKPGSYSVIQAINATQTAPVTQESVVSYELGTKLALFNRVLTLDGAVFYSDYRNKQILGTTVIPEFGNLPALVNIPKSRVYGAELQAVLRPVDGLRLTGGAAYYNSRVQKDPALPYDSFGTLTTFVGEELPSSPKWQLVGDAEYSFALSEGKKAFFGASTTYHSSNYAAFGNNPELLLPSYATLDLRAGVESTDGNWRAQIWGRNVTNKFYYINIHQTIDTVAGITGMPATYGITLSYRY